MSDIISSPMGISLPYSSLFSVPSKETSKRRSPQYFWDRAVATSGIKTSDTEVNKLILPTSTSSHWDDDVESTAWIDCEDDEANELTEPGPSKKKKSFAKIRKITFRSVVAKGGSKRVGNVVASELVSQQVVQAAHGKKTRRSRLTVFRGWRIKSKGSHTQVKKLVAVVRHRISNKSDEDQKPKTWEEYHRLYAMERIDVNDPPLPPTEFNDETPTPYQEQRFDPGPASDEAIRQLIINRLEICGKGGYEVSDEANEKHLQRVKVAQQLELEGKVPTSLSQSWNRQSFASASETGTDLTNLQDCDLTPVNLEQHPVFRKIVKKCTDMFQTAHSIISIMEADRQIFLAISNGGDQREAPRVFSMCTHTILSGRKGFVILDAQKDWRFALGPLCQHWGARFYAGVPLLSPNIDGQGNSQAASYPIGTLCIIDNKPRDEFGLEQRKKLVYMAEYARRELEKWFMQRMQDKLNALEESRRTWSRELRQVESLEEEVNEITEVVDVAESAARLTLAPEPVRGPVKKRSFGGFRSNRSEASTPPTSPSSAGHPPLKSLHAGLSSLPGLLDEGSRGLKPKTQKLFDMATKLVGDTLDLSLVYLLGASAHPHSSDTGRAMVLSGHNLPHPLPTFDAGLHLRALRASEGGLLYQNPSTQEAEEAAMNPRSINEAEAQSYDSAILVRVGELHSALPNHTEGFVLAGFTSDVKRVFGAEDVLYMKQFAAELAPYTTKLKL